MNYSKNLFSIAVKDTLIGIAIQKCSSNFTTEIFKGGKFDNISMNAVNRNLSTQILKHTIVIAIFVAVALIYFSPLLQNKVLNQGDIDRWYGASKEITDFRNVHDAEPLWTNSMFGGMPSYPISTRYPFNLIQYIDKALTLGIPNPANYLFLYFAGFYLLLIVINVDYRLAVIGALAFGLSSYFFIIIASGHNTKAEAIGYMAPVLAGIILTYRGKYLIGGALTGLAVALEINAGHPQVTYYLILLLMVMLAFQVYKTFKDKLWKSFINASAIILTVTVIAILSNLTSLYAMADYSKYSIRGPSDLTARKTATGLSKDAVFEWSYGIGETMTMLVPNFKGGRSNETIHDEDGALNNVNPIFQENIGNFPAYWGNQKFTNGPVYVGAIVCFLFLLGLMIVEGNNKWWILVGTILSILLAWGKNFPDFNYWMYEHFPEYDKFRSVTIVLIIAEFCMPLLAVFALNRILNTKYLLTNKKRLYTDIVIASAITFLIFISATIYSDTNKTIEVLTNGKIELKNEYTLYKDQLIKQGHSNSQAEEFNDNVTKARDNILFNDAVRSFGFIALAGLLICAYARFNFRKQYLIIGMGLLIVGDLWAVDKRYLNDDSFKYPNIGDIAYLPQNADLEIQKDKSLDYRVMNIQGDPFNDARTSFFHKSIGGYNGAILQRFHELKNAELLNEISKINNSFKTRNQEQIKQAMASADCINMLNGKYIIDSLDGAPYLNTNALGNCWFVKDYKIVENADSELNVMGKFDPASIAVIDAQFKSSLGNLHPAPDSLSTIKLTNYLPNDLTYHSNTTSEQLAVFSEVYFSNGWNAYLDGKPAKYFRTDYILRGMNIPAGNHLIEFKFEPAFYAPCETISLISSLLLLSFIGGTFAIQLRTKLKEKKQEIKPVLKQTIKENFQHTTKRRLRSA